MLDTDASDTTLGVVLQQEQNNKLHVVGYASRTLSPAEARYCITRRELLGVVFGLKKYRQHLLGRPIIVRTDHAAVKYLMSTPNPLANRDDGWISLVNTTSPSNIVQAGFMAIAMLCHSVPVRGARRWTVSSVNGQPRRWWPSQSPATHCWQMAPLCCRRHFAYFRSIHRPTSPQTCPLSTPHPSRHCIRPSE